MGQGGWCGDDDDEEDEKSVCVCVCVWGGGIVFLEALFSFDNDDGDILNNVDNQQHRPKQCQRST